MIVSYLVTVGVLDSISNFPKDNQINYPKKEIIQTFIEDINNDMEIDKVSLIINNVNHELIITVNDVEEVIKTNVNREQLFGHVLSNQYKYDLIINGNKILVALLYTGTQKYGSSAYVNCYEYSDNKIKKIWSSKDYEEKCFLITEVDVNNKNLRIDMFGEIKDKIITDEDIEYINYKERECDLLKEPILESVIITTYGLNINDNDIQLIIPLVIWSGAGPIGDNYIMVFNCTEEGIWLQDSWFESKELRKSNLINYKEW
jgi:hypothetical protein